MFFKKKIEKQNNNQLIKIAALMIHAGKIDENFSKQEEMIIKQALLKMGANTENIKEIIEQSKIIEENANQILDFTKEVKAMDDEKKIEIIETLWRIIYSNKDADVYETNLMRRLAGLMYIDNKIMGSIQEKIKKALLKMGANTENIQEIIEKSKVIEENANQILDFTKEVKVMDEEKKIEIIETLWRIIYSNKPKKIFKKTDKQVEKGNPFGVLKNLNFN